MLLDLLSNILELPSHLVINEAQKKLQQTYMVVNGELLYIKEIGDHFLHTSDGNSSFFYGDLDFIDGIHLESLSPWIPETGISFITPDSRVILYKYPEKQWRKSFCYDFYQISPLDLVGDEMKYPYLIFDNGLIPTQKPYLFKNRAYYLDKQIGHLKDKKKERLSVDKPTLFVTDDRFFQECYEEFSKDFIVWPTN